MRIRRIIELATLGLVLSAAGCAQSRVKVEGEVTLDGKALPKTMVQLTPLGGKGRDAYGTTDDNGHFVLMSDAKEGVIPGEYKVTFAPAGSQTIDDFKPDPNIDPSKRVKEFQDKARKDSESAKKRGEAIHGNYTKVDSTPFTLKIPPDGPVKFALKSDGTK